MSLIKLDNVYLEYSPIDDFDDEEAARLERKRIKEEKKRKKRGEDPSDAQPFGDLSSPADVSPPTETPQNSGVFSEFPDGDSHNYAVAGVSLEIEEGEYIALVGRNGSGKSTLAKLLNGLLLPTSGDVYVDGMNTKNKKDLFAIRKQVGMVFQNPDNQMIASIVEDDIAFGPENIGVPPGEIEERVRWALDSVGMTEQAKSTPFKLSGGQKQRIAIAGMLAIKPRVLVLDESTAMLDPRGRREVTEVAKRLNREEKMTVINITHYMDEVIDCDRVIVLDRGKAVFDASPEEVFSGREKLRELGLALPNVLKIAEKLREKGIDIGADTFSAEELVARICRLSRKN